MSEESAKTYVFDSASKGTDPASLLAMMNSNGGFGGNNWMWVIFLFFLYGWGGNGLFGRGSQGGLASEINGDYGRSLLLQAINGNGTAISQLASTLNCDINAVQGAISRVESSLASVGNAVGMTGAQVTSAIQAGNQTLASQLASCCCENKMLITTLGYENRIAADRNTSLLGAKIDAQTATMLDKFCDIEKRELTNKIDSLTAANTALRGQIDNANQTAAITSYVNSAIAPIVADVSAIKAATPSTVSVPYPQLSVIPTYGYGYNTGAWA